MTLTQVDIALITLNVFVIYWVYLGIITGNPGVFQGYPDPYLQKPIPALKGMGFCG